MERRTKMTQRKRYQIAKFVGEEYAVIDVLQNSTYRSGDTSGSVRQRVFPL